MGDSPLQSGRSGTLEARILREINSAPGRKISFSRFMELALYAPPMPGHEAGYYMEAAVSGGRLVDFLTHPVSQSPQFGYAAGIRICDLWRIMGTPTPFEIVLMGEGDGTLLRDMLRGIKGFDPRLYGSLRVKVIEISQKMADVQRSQISNEHPVEWVMGSVLEVDFPIITYGVVISNELPDAFPVELISIGRDGLPRHIFVEHRNDCSDGQEFCGTGHPLQDERICEYLALAGKPLKPRSIIPVNLNAVAWMERVTQSIQHGYHIVFDIGVSAGLYPDEPLLWTFNQEGLLRGIFDFNPYKEVGKRDIISSVDFDVLREVGERYGARTNLLGYEESFFWGTGWDDQPSQFLGPSNPIQRRRDETLRVGQYVGYLVMVQGINTPAFDWQDFRELS